MSVMRFTSGLPETECGAGSTVSYTENIRNKLPGLMRNLGVTTLLDAPCGDFNWMSRTNLSGINYIGADYDYEQCQAVRSKLSEPPHYAPKAKIALLIDIRNSIPVKADMMLCRDFLQHLPNRWASTVLRNFFESKIPWLLCTSHKSNANSDIEEFGQFRPLNLRLRPFSLPAPHLVIDDGPGRILGLWHRDQIV